MDYKILQIIPNTKNLAAEYEDEEGYIYELPIICFALIEWEDGDRTVEPMDMTKDGKVDLLYTETVLFK